MRPRIAEIVPHAIGPDPAALRNTIGRLLLRRGEYGTARRLLAAAHSEANDLFGPLDPDTMAYRRDLAEALRDAGEPAEAEKLLADLLDEIATIPGFQHIEVPLATNDLGAVRRGLDRNEDVRPLYRAAVRGMPTEADPVPPELNLAELRLDEREGLALYKRAYRQQTERLGAEHPQTLIILNNLAEAYRLAGDLPAARDSHERALASRRRVLGPEHPATAVSMNNLAVTLQALGQCDEGRVLLAEAVTLHAHTLDTAARATQAPPRRT